MNYEFNYTNTNTHQPTNTQQKAIYGLLHIVNYMLRTCPVCFDGLRGGSKMGGGQIGVKAKVTQKFLS